jgi:hypothetical protein
MSIIEHTLPSPSTPSPNSSIIADNSTDKSSAKINGSESEVVLQESIGTSDPIADKSTDETSTKDNDNESKVVLEASTDSGGTTASSNKNSNDGIRFTYFKKLPPEIRRKIWKEACSIP